MPSWSENDEVIRIESGVYEPHPQVDQEALNQYRQELMSHPKGGEGAFNYVVTALSKVLAVL